MRRTCGLLFLLTACHSAERAPSSDSLAADVERAMSTLRHDTATVLGLAAEGSTLDAAYRDATLQRLRAVHLGEMGRATETFYFDTALFLVVRGEVHYDAPLSGQVTDSSTRRFDLRSDSTPKIVRDSLQAEARTLLDHLKSARKP